MLQNFIRQRFIKLMKYKKNVFTDQKLKLVKLKRISGLLSYCKICSYDVDFVSLKFYK